MDVEQVQEFIGRVEADYGAAYVSVVSVACQWYNMLAYNNGITDPYHASTLETQARQAWQLDGMVKAAAAILRAEPHTLDADRAKDQAQGDIRRLAAVLVGAREKE